ncbi:hypothetical protein Hypma_012596 [Hypsizygus marmoreus]|uniref:DUF6697 domain-containing protein n=1 Tax=Hypsizygus marmoreus TaxID=39966 RepID=A0A369JGL7_HYPMA|nr:hypothetical protein Hypma_012596 [Hypsizygus marmoreus]
MSGEESTSPSSTAGCQEGRRYIIPSTGGDYPVVNWANHKPNEAGCVSQFNEFFEHDNDMLRPSPTTADLESVVLPKKEEDVTESASALLTSRELMGPRPVDIEAIAADLTPHDVPTSLDTPPAYGSQEANVMAIKSIEGSSNILASALQLSGPRVAVKIELPEFVLPNELLPIRPAVGEAHVPPNSPTHRMFIDAVEIPYPSWKKKRDLGREKEYLNPKWKIKIKKNEFTLGLDTVFRRVDTLGIKNFSLELNDDLLNTPVSREFISDVYGGNPQQTFPLIGADNLKRHGYDDFMFLNLDYNPRAPQRAGYPGLFFVCSNPKTSAVWPVTQRTFVRLDDKKWLYIGQYDLVRAAGLTVDEWKSQPHSVMMKWSTKVCDQQWGRDVRTRIALRKTLHREPTPAEVEQALTRNYAATPDEVTQAYNNGSEVIGVWVMKCVGYDEKFQKEIIGQFETWTLPPRGPAKRKGKRKQPKEEDERLLDQPGTSGSGDGSPRRTIRVRKKRKIWTP